MKFSCFSSLIVLAFVQRHVCLLQTLPKTSFTQAEIESLTDRIQNAGTEVVNAKAGAVSQQNAQWVMFILWCVIVLIIYILIRSSMIDIQHCFHVGFCNTFHGIRWSKICVFGTNLVHFISY